MRSLVREGDDADATLRQRHSHHPRSRFKTTEVGSPCRFVVRIPRKQVAQVHNLPFSIVLFEDASFVAQAGHVEPRLAGGYPVLLERDPRNVTVDPELKALSHEL